MRVTATGAGLRPVFPGDGAMGGFQIGPVRSPSSVIGLRSRLCCRSPGEDLASTVAVLRMASSAVSSSFGLLSLGPRSTNVQLITHGYDIYQDTYQDSSRRPSIYLLEAIAYLFR